MGRYKLRSPDQPFVVRCLLGLYEFCASLKMAVVLIFAAAAALGWATFVESAYGTPAVHFGLYGTWWFTALCSALALTIFCAATIRYPWKRHQTGFVITHIGLLTLLFGCLLSRQGGIDAQMPITEGTMNSTAYEGSQHFELAIRRDRDHVSAHDGSIEGSETVIKVPFQPGPFNWNDYDHDHWLPPLSLVRNSDDGLPYKLAWNDPRLFWFPWGLAKRSQGELYNQDGIRLELLDYYADSEQVDAPYVKLWLSTPQAPRMGADGREHQGPQRWVPVELRVLPTTSRWHKAGQGDRQAMGGGEILFMLATSDEQTKAFLNSQPQGTLGAKGQIVLYTGGQAHRVDAQEKLGQPPFPLGDSGLKVEVTKYFNSPTRDPQGKEEEFDLIEDSRPDARPSPALELLVHRGDAPPQRMVLFADIPELNIDDPGDGVYGTYWFDHGEKTAQQRMSGEQRSRIDLLQGADRRLYYRYWNGHQLALARELPTDGMRVDAFKMPIAQLQMYVEPEGFVPSERPAKIIVPKRFDKDTKAVSAFRAAKVRLTVDGKAEEFWLNGPPPSLNKPSAARSEVRTVAGDDRRVSIAMPLDRVEMGFRVRLRDFEMKLDPGTSQPSHYSSYVDFVDLRDDDKRYRSNEFITMNAPVDFRDPVAKRSYRLFQESYSGPFKPGDAIFEQNVRADSDRKELYNSVLTVNYDPGRGVKYAGGMLVVSGIVTMFYMRAYFFKPQGPPRSQSAAKTMSKPRSARQPVA